MKKIVLLCLMGFVVSVGYCQRGMLFPKRPNGNAFRGAAINSGIKSIGQYDHLIKNIQQINQQKLDQINRNSEYRLRKLEELRRKSEEQRRKLEELIPISGLQVLQKMGEKWLEQTPDSMLYKRASNSLFSGDTTNYVKLLRLAVKKGYGPALYDYGRMLVIGEYVEKDPKQGWQLIRKAAERGNPNAMYELGREYYYSNYGTALPHDTIQGLVWMRKAADADTCNLRAQLLAGVLCCNQGDTIHAIKYYARANEYSQNNPLLVEYYYKDWKPYLVDADLLLGYCHYYGKETPQNVNSAVKYWNHAAHLGDGEAAYYVGFRLLEGTEVPQNIPQGIKYIQMAERLGYTNDYIPECQAYIGDCYMNGYNVERDSMKAIEWWKKAGEAGHAGAQYCLTCKYYQANDNDSTIYWGEKPECKDSSLIQYCVGMAYYCKDNTEEAKNWWKKAADQNLPDACWWLSSIEWENDSVAAFPYLQKAAELNYPEAICDMGIEYLYGGFVEKDQEKAVKLLSQAAEMGCANAFNTLGIIYFWKEYKRMDRKLAVEYWKRGAELDPELWGTADCQYNYGMCLKKGHGVKKDKEAAIYWLKLAAKNGSEEAKEELQKMHIGIEEE